LTTAMIGMAGPSTPNNASFQANFKGNLLGLSRATMEA
jgi:hypothetical protein